MSWQAQTAVTLHSKQTNVKRLRLLLFLANVAQADGSIDPAPNQKTMADFIGCTTRTIRTMLNQLADDKELVQTRIGSGPGNPSAYQITLPMAEMAGNLEPKGGKMAETNPGIVSTFAQLKAEILELKAEINQLKAEILELKGGKVEDERRKGRSTENADDPYFDPFFDPIPIQGVPLQRTYPDEPPTDDFSAAEMAMWQTAVSLATRWAKYRGTYRQLDPNKDSDADDYFRPILGLVVECKGDGQLAWSLLEKQCQQMLADGLTVIRAGPVVAQIRNEQQRAALPARKAPNGRSHSRAEQVAAEYAAMRQEFLSSE
ncbi:MAG: hypothetical protein KC449_09635 [Anaerolineales bacterium]|nr:hypothetical protein [Anaerolineales bacterium]